MMKKYSTIVIGAGIGGLASAAELKSKNMEFVVLERSKELPLNLANGLHYLHSKDFGAPFDFYFKTCVMSEQIWNTRTNKFTTCATIQEMFEYSKKVAENMRHPSSIMDPGKRVNVFVPESNNMNDLLLAYHDYIGKENFEFGADIKKIDTKEKIIQLSDGREFLYDGIITTAPLNCFLEVCGMENPYELKFKKLFITNYKTTNIVPNWLIVLYMSDPKFPPYRMTTFNGQISMESMHELSHEDEIVIKYLIGDLFDYDLSTKQEYNWPTGRIFGLERKDRVAMLDKFNKLDIYPIGRYAEWDGKLIMDSTILRAKEIVNKIQKYE